MLSSVSSVYIHIYLAVDIRGQHQRVVLCAQAGQTHLCAEGGELQVAEYRHTYSKHTPSEGQREGVRVPPLRIAKQLVLFFFEKFINVIIHDEWYSFNEFTP